MNSKLPPLVETNGNSIIMNLENVRPYLLFDDGFGENQDNNMVSPDLIKIIEELSGDLVSGDRSNVEENGKGSALKVDHSQSQIEIAPLGGLLTDLGQFDLFLENIDPQVRNGFVDPFQGAPLKYPNLFSLLERRVGEASEKRRLRQLVVESQPKQSKWYDPNRHGQAELYDALEKVLFQLKSFAPHSIPFLQKVNRKEVPDYYEIVKRPMDLGTMYKKLKSLEYLNKQQFLDDLNLIYENCYLYNAEVDSPFRKNVNYLRDRWITLLTAVPEISVQPREKEEKDDIDTLILCHLDRLSEEGSDLESIGGTPKRIKTKRQSSSMIDGRAIALSSEPSPLKETVVTRGHASPEEFPLRDTFDLPFPGRSPFLMQKYKEGSGRGRFSEFKFFHQSIPDSKTISLDHHMRPHKTWEPYFEGDNPDSSVFECGQAIHEFRSLILGSITAPSMFSPARLPSVPPLALGMGAGLERRALANQISLLLYIVGFERIQMPVINILSDLFTTIIRRLLLILKLNIEDSCYSGGVIVATKNILHAFSSPLYSAPSRTSSLQSKSSRDFDVPFVTLDLVSALISFITEEPKRRLGRIKKATGLVQSYHAAVNKNREGPRSPSAGSASASSGNQSEVVDDDLDLEMLSNMDDTTTEVSYSASIRLKQDRSDADMDDDGYEVEDGSPNALAHTYSISGNLSMETSLNKSLSDLLGISPAPRNIVNLVSKRPPSETIQTGNVTFKTRERTVTDGHSINNATDGGDPLPHSISMATATATSALTQENDAKRKKTF